MTVLTLLKYVFSLIGALAIAGSLFALHHTRGFLAEATLTEGQVIQLVRSVSADSITYRPVIRFTTANQREIEFTASVGSNPPTHRPGDKVPVYYRLEFPERARVAGFFSLWGLPVILGGLGSVFFFLGASFFLVPGLTARQHAELKQKGVPISTRFQGVEINQRLTMNGRHPYQVVSQWVDPTTNQVHVFRSENLWLDPTDGIDREEISVLLDRKNPKRYLMDLSFLPKLAR